MGNPGLGDSSNAFNTGYVYVVGSDDKRELGGFSILSKTILGVMPAVVVGAVPASANVWNVANDFSPTGNPNSLLKKGYFHAAQVTEVGAARSGPWVRYITNTPISRRRRGGTVANHANTAQGEASPSGCRLFGIPIPKIARMITPRFLPGYVHQVAFGYVDQSA